MRNDMNGLYEMINETVSFKYYTGGGKKPYKPHITEWRNLPFLVIVYVKEGSYFSEIKNMGRFYAGKDQAVLVPSGIIHRVGMDIPAILSFAHLHYTFAETMDLLDFFDVPFVTDTRHGKMIDKALECLSHSHGNNNFKFKEIAASKATGFKLLEILMKISEEKEGSMPDIIKIKRLSAVLGHIQAHLSQEIKRRDLADILSVSETRFHYIFKEAMGMSPMEYIMKLRIEKAQILLITTGLPVSGIASEVGYKDLFHFSRIFKSKVGMSPLNYRCSQTKYR